MLDGIWIPHGAEFSGEALPAPESRWVITGTRYVVESEAGRDEGELRIDAAARPATVDLVGTSGPHGNKTIRAIFRLRGDLLQFCYDVSGDDRRPVVFATGKGSMQLMVRYRRIAQQSINQDEARLMQ
jgi:uncharacterized protein (TIGR03067 family)